jgi:DNA polymerase elongation subunit (family B)
MFDKNNSNVEETFLVSKEDEIETLLDFSCQVKRLDPDIILTKGGDQFLFPHLLHRAKINKIESHLLLDLNRETDWKFLQKKYESILKADDKENNPNHDLLSSIISMVKCISNQGHFIYRAEFILTAATLLFIKTMDKSI